MSRTVKLELTVYLPDEYEHNGDAKDILDHLEDRHSDVSLIDAKITENDIKKLWKPSKEQMSAMKLFVEKHRQTANQLVGGWPTFDSFELLYEDLKKL